MHAPMHLAFRHTQMSPELATLIEREANKLSRLFIRISALSVVVERPNHRHRSGDPCSARVEIDVPGQHLVASQSHDGRFGSTEPCAVLADAFRSAQHSLKRYAERLSHDRERPEHRQS